ncbi:MAG: hypothetical protein MUF83_13355 [Acidimicrobiales bacterium]|jgi:diacylglycerol kinase family enzyme|nr:hypothetical protein [Acidimicrobiales bacterium]
MDPNAHSRPRRLAAVAALACWAAALIGAVVFFLDNVLLLLGTVVFLMVAVVGAWWAVTRREAWRIAGLVVAAVGLVAAMVLFVGDGRLVEAVVMIALVAASATCARIALARDLPTLQKAQIVGEPVGPARRATLIMNPKSGGGKAEKFHLVEECRARGIEPIVLEKGQDLLQLAEDAIARGCDVIGMAGGDGSQALVASVAARHGIPHVVVPAGTRNHFALDLGIDRDDVVGALDAFGEALERPIDLAEVNGRVFVNNCSLGLYAKIVQSDAYRDDKAGTTLQLLPEMLGPEAEPFDLRFTGPDGAPHTSAHLIQVSNNPYDLNRITVFGTRPRIDTGRLEIVTASITSAAEMTRFLTLRTRGRMQDFPGYEQWTAPTFDLDSGSPIEIGVDGEAMVLEGPLHFEIRPAAVRVRIPTHAPGLSPAAARPELDWKTAEHLWHVAVHGELPTAAVHPVARSGS